MSQPAVSAAPTIAAKHYQALCGLALAAVVLLRFQQSVDTAVNPSVVLIINVLILFIGAVSILYRARLSPMLFLLMLAAPQILEQYYANQAMNAHLRTPRVLDVANVGMSLAGLVFFIGLYRLHGLWFGVLPADTRQRGDPARPPVVRSEDTLSVGELLPLIFTVPVFALLSEFALVILNQRWNVIDLPYNWRRFLFAAWVLLLVLFLTAHAFRYWRRLQMDRATALVMLQDILWHETRGEQRRIQRWLAWKKLREGEK